MLIISARIEGNQKILIIQKKPRRCHGLLVYKFNKTPDVYLSASSWLVRGFEYICNILLNM